MLRSNMLRLSLNKTEHRPGYSAELRIMPNKTMQESSPTSATSQTPFDRFKTALAKIVSVPKTALPKSSKKSRKK